jgi:signal peptidase I
LWSDPEKVLLGNRKADAASCTKKDSGGASRGVAPGKGTIMRAKDQAELIAVKSQRTVFQEYSEAFVVAVILAIIIRALFVQAFKIPSSSMEPTLLVGDHILVNKLLYGVRIPFTKERWPRLSVPKRGDVIVFVFPEDRTKDFIKRVVGVGGDTMEVRNKQVYVNGKLYDNPHARHYDSRTIPEGASARDFMPPVKVPKDHLFVMGDNRDYSHDSRFWGFVPVEDVKGEAFLIYYSAQDFPSVRWDRFFKVIR